MRLVDTSAWIEWLTGSRLGLALEAELPLSSECLVPTMVQLELARWLTREASDDKADQVIAFTAWSPTWIRPPPCRRRNWARGTSWPRLMRSSMQPRDCTTLTC